MKSSGPSAVLWTAGRCVDFQSGPSPAVQKPNPQLKKQTAESPGIVTETFPGHAQKLCCASCSLGSAQPEQAAWPWPSQCPGSFLLPLGACSTQPWSWRHPASSGTPPWLRDSEVIPDRSAQGLPLNEPRGAIFQAERAWRAEP